MSRTRFALILSILGGIAAGLGGGYLLWGGGKGGEDTLGKKSAITAAAVPAGNTRTGSRVADSASADGKTKAEIEWLARVESADVEAHRKALTERTTEVLAIRSAPERMQKLLEMLQHFRPGDIEFVVDGFKAHDQQGRLFPAEFDMFMEFAGARDGLRAMERTREVLKSPDANLYDFHRRCMSAWAAASPEEAVKWWNGLPDGKMRDQAGAALISGVLKTDADRAWKYLQMFPAEDRIRHAGAFTREFLNQGGVPRAAEWLRTLDQTAGEDSTAFKSAAAQSLLHGMVNIKAPEKAAAFEPFLNEPWFAGSGCLERLTDEWGKKNAAEAAAWLEARSKTPAFNSAAGALIARWGKTDPEAAAAWGQKMGIQP
ncbi:MAG TPA: hypothetical protein VG796_01650 [Verrucomicrobiales bacterium]|jgi:hypothetical protein|nr:hypothetical protein [Verrucomicrobiales bacterium]